MSWSGHQHLVITGLMGVGKSTTAAALAARLGWPARDSDGDLLALFGVSGATIAHESGVETLHRLEAAVLLGALAADGPTVIAAAASVVDDPLCRQAMGRRAIVVILQAGLDEIVARMSSGSHRRPMSRDELERLAQRRRPLFAEVADLTVDAAEPASRQVDRIVAAVAVP